MSAVWMAARSPLASEQAWRMTSSPPSCAAQQQNPYVAHQWPHSWRDLLVAEGEVRRDAGCMALPDPLHPALRVQGSQTRRFCAGILCMQQQGRMVQARVRQ
jgi:hypothetical protein